MRQKTSAAFLALCFLFLGCKSVSPEQSLAQFVSGYERVLEELITLRDEGYLTQEDVYTLQIATRTIDGAVMVWNVALTNDDPNGVVSARKVAKAALTEIVKIMDAVKARKAAITSAPPVPETI